MDSDGNDLTESEQKHEEENKIKPLENSWGMGISDFENDNYNENLEENFSFEDIEKSVKERMKYIDHEAKNYSLDDFDGFADSLLENGLTEGYDSPLLPLPSLKRNKHKKSSSSSRDTDKSNSKKCKVTSESEKHKSSKSQKSSGKSNTSGKSFDDTLLADQKKKVKKREVDSKYTELISKFKIKKKGTEGDKSTGNKSSDNKGSKSDAKGSNSVKIKQEKPDKYQQSGSKRKSETQLEKPVTKQIKLESFPSGLPEPMPDYKPKKYIPPPEEIKKGSFFDESVIGTKTYDRTKVYSGKKSTVVPEVYKLQDICMQILMNNIESLDYVGGVPFYILKPVLEKCTPNDLYRLEDCNPRRSDEREEKLKAIRQSISAAQVKKDPLRQTKLAYVDSMAKPPREVRRQQLKYGTSVNVTGERFRKFTPGMMDVVPLGKSRPVSKAPMMAKTLNMIKKIRK
ncbi:ELOA [Mytilus edulis]|uniref:ELOA n=1 Tax=Mytilus edulis TaxID=6550 RepID=A0A8S3RGX2_MYTED|nr:ELOA [Mytilus edulis]